MEVKPEAQDSAGWWVKTS